MSESAIATDEPLLLDNLLPTCREALASSDSLLCRAQRAISARIAPDGGVDGALLETEQFAAHGYAWLSTYVEALRQMLDWGERTDKAGQFGEREALTDAPTSLPEVKLGHLSKKVDEIMCRAILGGAKMSLRDGIAFEARCFGDVCATKDMRIGVENFLTNGPRSPAQFVHA